MCVVVLQHIVVLQFDLYITVFCLDDSLLTASCSTASDGVIVLAGLPFDLPFVGLSGCSRFETCPFE
jgi:hypothetical protein